MNYDASHVEHISNLMTSDGWQIMQTWLEGRITYHKVQLESCKLEDVEKHRASLSAYKAALNQPQHIIDEVTSVEQDSK